jgi:hypothetical protein
MNTLWNFNLWAYHTLEVRICDVKLAVYNWQIRQYDRRIKELEARLTTAH